jgi:S1-C subfamily serine protease
MESLRKSRVMALGIAGQNVPGCGVRIQLTAPDAAARVGDLRIDDIIVEVDGTTVGDVDELRRLVELQRLMTEERIGKPVPMTVLRQTQKLEITVTPRESPPRAAG